MMIQKHLTILLQINQQITQTIKTIIHQQMKTAVILITIHPQKTIQQLIYHQIITIIVMVIKIMKDLQTIHPTLVLVNKMH